MPKVNAPKQLPSAIQIADLRAKVEDLERRLSTITRSFNNETALLLGIVKEHGERLDAYKGWFWNNNSLMNKGFLGRLKWLVFGR